MTSRLPEYFQLDKHGVQPEGIVRLYLGCEPAAIRECAILTPVWNAGFVDQFPGITTVSEGRVYETRYQGRWITIIRSGIGAPQTGDAVLALGCTGCKRVIFTGSVGGLHPSMEIGDLLLVEESVSGEGFSRYMAREIETRDSFLISTQPDAAATEVLNGTASRICESESVPLHGGKVFSIDTILAQFFRLEYLVSESKCIGIEMETSATFNAARLAGIQAAAILQISDLPLAGRSLFSGKTAEENQRLRQIRATILPAVLLDSLMTLSA